MHAPAHDPSAILEHARGLRSLAVRLVGPDRAEDLVQDTYLKALEKPPAREQPLGPWLVRVLTNASYSLLRRPRPAAADGVDEKAASVPSPQQIAEELDAAERLIEAVGQLEHPASTIVSMRYFHDMDSKEIGRALELPAPTVRWHLQRALSQLRFNLRDSEKGREGGWVTALTPLMMTRVDHGARAGVVTGMRSAGGGSLGSLVPGIAAAILGGLAILMFSAGSRERVEPRQLMAPRSCEPTVIPMTRLVPARRILGPARSAEPALAGAPAAMTPAFRTGADQETDGLESTATVSVRVVDEQGAPVAGAELGPRSGGHGFATADAEGRCVLELKGPLEDGSGRQSLRRQLAQLFIRAPGFADLPIPDMQEVGDLDFGTRVLTRARSLSGRVIFQGPPVEGAEVLAFSMNDTTESVLARIAGTAEGEPLARAVLVDGAFGFETLGGDAVILALVTPGAQLPILASVTLPAVEPVVIDASMLVDEGPLQIRVLDAGGKPVPGARVVVPRMMNRAPMEADAAGRLSLPVSATGRGSATAWDAEGRHAPTTLKLGLDPSVELRLDPGVAHHIRLEDLAGQPVREFRWSMGFAGMVRTGAAHEGVATVLLPSDRKACRWKRADVDLLMGGEVVSTVRLKVGDPAAEHLCAMEEPGVVLGAVTSGGEPVPGASVILRALPMGPAVVQEPEILRAVRTGPSGTYRLETRSSGPLELRVDGPGFAPTSQLVVARMPSLERVDVELVRGGTVLGGLGFDGDLGGLPLFSSIRVVGRGPGDIRREIDELDAGFFRMEGLVPGEWSFECIGRTADGEEVRGGARDCVIDAGSTTLVSVLPPRFR